VRTNLSRDVEGEVRKHFDSTFRTVIPRSIRLAEAPSHGEPIRAYDPLSAGARAYDDLADELIERLASTLPAAARAAATAPAPAAAAVSSPSTTAEDAHGS
ncbi:MAG: ParA family protein, partial [Dehalococcoidia bacterium]|nr:ParA family protein [Dehalococcoidia bacterium]